MTDMENQEEVSTKLCTNCKHDIPSVNYVMHQTHCQRNIKLCEHCKEPVPRSEMEAHFEEEHKKVPCKCGESIEKCQLEEHEAKHCKQRSMKCEYCEIDLPFAKISEHKDFCGSRTELCAKCSRYIQLKDQDIHTASECTYPEVVPQPKSKHPSHMDQADGIGAVIPGWPGTWENDVQFLTGLHTNAHRSASDLYDLASPMRPRVWNPQVGLPQDLRRTSRDGTPADRRHRKNQDRVQNSFGVTGKKKVPGSSSGGGDRNGPWEKNQERQQQNRSQEESDRLLAMHLAQDLRSGGGGLEHPAFTSQDMLQYNDAVSEAEIDQILKEAYNIPAVNTYQEPKFTQSSPVVNDTTDASSMLPCEFCQEPFPPELLIVHESGCRPDVVSFASPQRPSTINNKQQPSHGLSVRPHVLDNLNQDMSPEWMPAPHSAVPVRKSSVEVDEEENSVMLPCEFCGDLLPAEFLSHHQVNCTDNGTVTPAPRDQDANQTTRNLNRFSPVSPPRPRPRKMPVPTSLDLNSRPLRHQADPNLDVLMASPDAKPTKDETSPRPRHTSQPRSRKTKVTSTVTRPGGHGVNLAVTPSPVDKYINGSPFDRDVSNGGMVAKPRVVTVERKVRGERPHNKSSIRGQHSVRNFSDMPVVEDDSLLDKDFDEDVTPIFSSEPGIRSKGKLTKKSSRTPTSPGVNDLNNKQKQAGNLRTKPLKKTSVEGEDITYQPSFGGSGERRKGSREKNNRHTSNKPSNMIKQSSSIEVEPDDEDDFVPLRLSKSSNHSTSGAKPKLKRRNKRPDDDTV